MVGATCTTRSGCASRRRRSTPRSSSGCSSATASSLPLIDGAVDAVRRLAPEFRLGVASSSNRPLIEAVLERAGIADLFDAVVSSEEVARGKPAPDVYLEAMRRLGAEPAATAAIEDSSNGIRSAHAAGMRVIALPECALPARAGRAGAGGRRRRVSARADARSSSAACPTRVDARRAQVETGRDGRPTGRLMPSELRTGDIVAGFRIDVAHRPGCRRLGLPRRGRAERATVLR